MPGAQEGHVEAFSVARLPEKYRKRLRTTNMLERFIQEIRRREEVIRIFPNIDSAYRLVGALCAETHEELWETIQRGEVYRNTFTDEAKDGSRIELDEVVVPIERTSGEIQYYSVTARDVTDHKRREEQLKEAKEKAEEAAALKSTMLANMSHEIRTPLTSILGFAEAIGDRAGSEEEAGEETVSRFARLIEQSGQRLMNTLNGVLNLSKLQAEEMNLDPWPVDLVAEAKETIEEFGPQAREAGVDLGAQFGSEAEEGGEDDSVWARADEGGVQIVLRNLLSNAIKYTDEGGEVRVRTRQTNDLAIVEVEDTGIGINPEEAQGLFEAFKQESEGVGRKYEGTGLGLTVTKEVLDQMGGSIEVETEKGKGSRFTVRLPAETGVGNTGGPDE